MEHRFEYLTSEELKPWIAKKAVVILGIGTVEEHGAHLPTGTDWFITQRFMDDVRAYLDKNTKVPFLTLPAIWTGYSAREMQRWPGTVRVSTRTVMNMMKELIDSLCEMGFNKFVIFNGHGHHVELLRVVARELADDHNVFPTVINIFSLGAKEYNAVRKGPAGGSIHGGEDETSVMMHYGFKMNKKLYTKVDHVPYHTEFIAGDNFIGSSKVFWSTWGYFKSTTGLLGDPTPSTPEAGKALADACLQNSCRFIQEYYERSDAMQKKAAKKSGRK